MQSVFHSCARLDGNCRRRAGVYQCRRHFGRFVKESGNGRIRSELNWPEKAFSTTDFESLVQGASGRHLSYFNSSALIAAIGNPSTTSAMTRRTTQFGISTNGKTWVATWITSQQAIA